MAPMAVAPPAPLPAPSSSDSFVLVAPVASTRRAGPSGQGLWAALTELGGPPSPLAQLHNLRSVGCWGSAPPSACPSAAG
eukprot:15438842-Alexandrium_andersonii.AAC.1